MRGKKARLATNATETSETTERGSRESSENRSGRRESLRVKRDEEKRKARHGRTHARNKGVEAKVIKFAQRKDHFFRGAFFASLRTTSHSLSFFLSLSLSLFETGLHRNFYL